MSLDDLLARTAPPTAPRTAALCRELDSMVLGTQPPARRSRRIGIAAAVAGTFLSTGTVAAAAAGLISPPAWVPWGTESGRACEMEFSVVPASADGGVAERPADQT